MKQSVEHELFDIVRYGGPAHRMVASDLLTIETFLANMKERGWRVVQLEQVDEPHRLPMSERPRRYTIKRELEL